LFYTGKLKVPTTKLNEPFLVLLHVVVSLSKRWLLGAYDNNTRLLDYSTTDQPIDGEGK